MGLQKRNSAHGGTQKADFCDSFYSYSGRKHRESRNVVTSDLILKDSFSSTVVYGVDSIELEAEKTR